MSNPSSQSKKIMRSGEETGEHSVSDVGNREQGAAKPSLSANKTSSQSTSVALKIIAIILSLIFSLYIYKHGSTSILNLSKASEYDLKMILYKPDKPYVFYCIKGHKGDDIKNVPSVYQDLHASRGGKYTFALLDCNKKIDVPTGVLQFDKENKDKKSGNGLDESAIIKKSIFDIYRINRKIKPTVFVTAPWMHPHAVRAGTAKQVPDGQLSDEKTLRKYVDTSLIPRASPCSSKDELNRLCGWGKHFFPGASDAIGGTCIAFVRGKRHGKEQIELEEKLIRDFPYNRYVSIAASKGSQLSFDGR